MTYDRAVLTKHARPRRLALPRFAGPGRGALVPPAYLHRGAKVAEGAPTKPCLPALGWSRCGDSLSGFVGFAYSG